MNPKKRIGEMLLEAGIIDETQLKAALGHQRQWGVRLGQALVDLKLATEADIVRALSLKFGFEVAKLDALEPYGQEQAVKLFPREFVTKHNVLPMWADTANVTVAMSDPTNLAVVDEIRFRTGRRVKVCIGGDREVAEALRRHYPGDGNVEAIALDLDPDPGPADSAVFDPFGGGSSDALEAFFGGASEAPPGVDDAPTPFPELAPPAPAPTPAPAPVQPPQPAAVQPAVRAPARPAPPPAPQAAPVRPAAPPPGAARAAAPAPAPATARPQPAPAAATTHPGAPRKPAPQAAAAAPTRPAPAATPAPRPAAGAPTPAAAKPAPPAPVPALASPARAAAAPARAPVDLELDLEEHPGAPRSADPFAAPEAPPPPPGAPPAAQDPPGAAPAAELAPGDDLVEGQPSRELTDRDLAVLESLDRLADGAPVEPDVVKPAQAMAAMIRLLIRKRLVTEQEFLDELSKK
jgi:hypothetical protein